LEKLFAIIFSRKVDNLLPSAKLADNRLVLNVDVYPKSKEIFQRSIRSYLKKVFWPNLFVGASFQILKILKYSSGLKRGPAAMLNQNSIFDMASI